MSAVQTTEKSAPTTIQALPRFFGSPWRWAMLCLGVALLVLFVLTGSDQWISVVNFTVIFAIAALGLNVLSGYAGQISLGITFFMSIGAYTAILVGGQPVGPLPNPTGLGLVHLYGLQLPFYIWLPASGIVAALVGGLIGPIALRLKGFYLGIVSLALVFIGIYIFQNVTLLSYQTQGRAFYTPCNLFTVCDPSTKNNLLLNTNPVIFGLTLSRAQLLLGLNLIILGIAALFVGNVMRSRAGRAFQAVRDHEVGAAIMGVNLFQSKMGAFILSSFLAGISGALYVFYTNYVSPGFWGLILSIQFIAAIIIGGIASVWGSILGALFIFALPTLIDQLNILSANTSTSNTIQPGDVSAIIYGLLIIVFLLFEPAGVVGIVRRLQPLVLRLIQMVLRLILGNWYARLFRPAAQKGGEPTSNGPDFEADSHLEVEQTALSPGEGTRPLAE